MSPRGGVGTVDGQTQGIQGRHDVDLDGLVGAPQRVRIVGEMLAVVRHVLALQLEGDDARLAVGPLLNDLQHRRLRDVAGQGKGVIARAQGHVVDVYEADVLAKHVVDEGGIALRRWVRRQCELHTDLVAKQPASLGDHAKVRWLDLRFQT